MRSISKKLVSLTLAFMMILGLAACNFQSSASRTATSDDIEKLVSKINEINPICVTARASFKGDQSTIDDIGSSIAYLVGFENSDMLDGAKSNTEIINILANIDRDKGVSSGTIRSGTFDDLEIDFIETDTTTYVDMGIFYKSLEDLELGLTEDDIKEVLGDVKYIDIEDRIDIDSILELNGIVNMAKSGYFDMVMEKKTSKETGTLTSFTMTLKDSKIEEFLEEKDVPLLNRDSLSIEVNLCDMDNSTSFDIDLSVKAEGIELVLFYTYSKSNGTIDAPSDSEVISLSDNIFGNEFTGSGSDPWDDSGDLGLDDYTGDTGIIEGFDTTDSNIDDDSYISPNITLSNQRGTLISSIRPDTSFSTSIQRYKGDIQVSESDMSSNYKSIGEYDFVSDFRRMWKNTYNTVISQLKADGFEETDLSGSDLNQYASYRLSGTGMNSQNLSINSYIHGSTYITYYNSVDSNDGTINASDDKLTELSNNIQKYIGIQISVDDLHDIITYTTNEAKVSDDGYFEIIIANELEDIELEVCGYPSMNYTIEISRTYK